MQLKRELRPLAGFQRGRSYGASFCPSLLLAQDELIEVLSFQGSKGNYGKLFAKYIVAMSAEAGCKPCARKDTSGQTPTPPEGRARRATSYGDQKSDHVC